MRRAPPRRGSRVDRLNPSAGNLPSPFPLIFKSDPELLPTPPPPFRRSWSPPAHPGTFVRGARVHDAKENRPPHPPPRHKQKRWGGENEKNAFKIQDGVKTPPLFLLPPGVPRPARLSVGPRRPGIPPASPA